MIVVGHEGEGVHCRPELVDGFRHQVEEHQAVVVLFEDRRVTAATVHHVMPRASKAGSGSSHHRPKICAACGMSSG